MIGSFLAQLIDRCLQAGIRTLEVTEEAEARWLAQLAAKHVDHQQFYEDCTPAEACFGEPASVVVSSEQSAMSGAGCCV